MRNLVQITAPVNSQLGGAARTFFSKLCQLEEFGKDCRSAYTAIRPTWDSLHLSFDGLFCHAVFTGGHPQNLEEAAYFADAESRLRPTILLGLRPLSQRPRKHKIIPCASPQQSGIFCVLIMVTESTFNIVGQYPAKNNKNSPSGTLFKLLRSPRPFLKTRRL